MMKHRPIILISIIWLGFGLRISGLGQQSLWYDEAVSAYLASQPLPDLIAHTARDIHPPGYYLLLHGWTKLVGASEFALAYLSLIFGMLLIAQIYRLARQQASERVALAAMLLAACSPFGVWYSQEVRMYTLGASLGLLVLACLPRLHRREGFVGYWLGAVVGLYTLYYFAFLLLLINLYWLINRRGRQLGRWVSVHGLIGLSYLPWLPTLWRQATEPPVPPWRTFDTEQLPAILQEMWLTLCLGQSINPNQPWAISLSLLMALLLVLGGYHLKRQFAAPIGLLLSYSFGPMLLLIGLSFIIPLYHVRYIFIYSLPLFLFWGAGLAYLLRFAHGLPAMLSALLLVSGMANSLYRYHTHPAYQTDDYRAAVSFLGAQWQPGDALLVNAGYVYPAVLYYNPFDELTRQRLVPYAAISNMEQPLLLQTGTVDGPATLGWGLPEADFYAMSEPETRQALAQLGADFRRLWLLRAYDTVTDPRGIIRHWLATEAIPLVDQPFTGESQIRVQGFLLPYSHTLPATAAQQTVHFADGLALRAWQLSPAAGEAVPVKLWWQANQHPTQDYKLSLKLWAEDGRLAAQGQDQWAGGMRYRSGAWQLGQPVYQATSLPLPADLPPGQYWLNVELYDPQTITPLPRLDGADPVVTLGGVVVLP